MHRTVQDKRQTAVIGLVGGLSWQSSALYYRLINQAMERECGGHNNAESVLVTVNFETVLEAGLAGDWGAVGRILTDAGRTLEAAGCGCVLLTANTAHKVADQVAAAVACPLLHIADATGAAIETAGATRPALLGTKPTLESGLFQERLDGCDILLPPPADRDRLHHIIIDELTAGEITEESATYCEDLVRRLAESGADSIIIGCTELPMLFDRFSPKMTVFNTTELHAEAAVQFVLNQN